MRDIRWEPVRVRLRDLRPWERNPRQMSKRAAERLLQSWREYGQVQTVAIGPSGEVYDGHQRLSALLSVYGPDYEILALRASRPLTEQERERLVLLLHAGAMGEWDWDALANWDVGTLIEGGFDEEMLDALNRDAAALAKLLESAVADAEAGADVSNGGGAVSRRPLADRFIVPPFSVLDARKGYWLERKRRWVGLGIASEMGRDAAIFGAHLEEYFHRSYTDNIVVSIFDPVLTEIMYRWFCPPGGRILDPFAGGSVRGIVAAVLGYEYVGIDLRPEQVAENRKQADEILGDGKKPVWIVGDSRHVRDLVDGEFDFFFTCPPYYDLEKYSDDERDLSNFKSYDEFIDVYSTIIHDSVAKLRENRFAAIVVGEVRDKRGNYYGFVRDTITAFENAGMSFYNDAVLVTPVGSLPVRVSRQFVASRKLGKTHQNVLVFVKGDARAAVDAIGEMDEDEVRQAIDDLAE